MKGKGHEYLFDIEKKHADEFNSFPMFWAFSNKQLEKGMIKLGLTMDDTGQIFSAGGGGGYYRKTDSKKLKDLLSRHTEEMEAAIKADVAGDGFIFEMFDYELSNHEYCITHDTEPTLDALVLTVEDIEGNPNLLNGLRAAIRAQSENA